MLKDNYQLLTVIMDMFIRLFIRLVHIKFIIFLQKFLIIILVWCFAKNIDQFFLHASLFSSEEATAHFRKAFPELVRTNEEPVLVSFARMFKIFITQRGIDHDVRVFTYSDDTNTNKKKLS